MIALFLLQGHGKARDGAEFYCHLTFLTGQKLMPNLRDSLFWQRAAGLVLVVKRYLPSVAKSMKHLVQWYLWNLVECVPLTQCGCSKNQQPTLVPQLLFRLPLLFQMHKENGWASPLLPHISTRLLAQVFLEGGSL